MDDPTPKYIQTEPQRIRVYFLRTQENRREKWWGKRKGIRGRFDKKKNPL